MGPRREEQSELVSTARALEDEVQHFQKLAETLARQKLDSGDAVERAARLLTEALDCEAQIKQRITALSSALQGLGQRQEAQVLRIQERSGAIQERSEAYRKLMAQYEALGQAARDLNVRVRPMMGGDDSGGIAGAMIEIEAGASDLAMKAGTLATRAEESEFSDIARLADALRQQLLAALNKLKLVSTRFARA